MLVGEIFIASTRCVTLISGDSSLALPKTLPLAIRAQGFVQAREAGQVSPVSGPTGDDAELDFQAPYLVKLLSSAPLSENISFYFYGIFAEKGGNGETVIEDAWFSYSDIAGTGATRVGVLADVVVLAPSLTANHVRQGSLVFTAEETGGRLLRPGRSRRQAQQKGE